MFRIYNFLPSGDFLYFEMMLLEFPENPLSFITSNRYLPTFLLSYSLQRSDHQEKMKKEKEY